MSHKPGRNKNTNSESIISDSIEVTPTVSVKVADLNDHRMYFYIVNIGNFDAKVKLQAAGVDNDSKGVFLHRNGGYWEMTPDNIETSEISAISIGKKTQVQVTEY